jgi:cardiolipin synthase
MPRSIFRMKGSKMVLLSICVLVIILLIAGVQFFFNPLGLGPEPDTVLSSDFFTVPSRNLDELELLVDGEEAFTKIMAAIDSATDSIYIQTYIWKDDLTGKQVVTGLKSAIRKGVKVTVRKDILGTVFELGDILKGKPSPVFTKEGLKEHENINVQLEVFADTDHSKYFIVDERLVIVGGMNIADEYHTQWHDYMVLIRSSRWAKAFKNKVLDSIPWPAPAPFVITVNDRKATEIRTAFIEMIDNADENIIIEHAYFSDDKVIAAVKRAAAKGVVVEIILPAKPDTHGYANMVTVNKLLSPGTKKNVRIYFFPKMSHAKVALADGKIAVIGSANLTPRSMLTSREVALFVHGTPDDPFIKKLRDQLAADIAESKPASKNFELNVADRIKALAGKYMW